MRRFGLLGLTVLVAAAPVWAADAPPPPGWYSKSGLSYVMAAGNSSASTLGAKAEVKRLWTKSTFFLSGTAVRSESTDPARQAVGTPDDFQVESGPSVLKASKYTAATTFDRSVTQRLAWEVGAGFERDRFAGINGRTLGLAGLSYLLANRKDFIFKSAAGLTLTHQSEVVDDPETPNTFVGLRLGLDVERKFWASSSYVGGLAFNENLQELSDARIRFANALSASMNDRLALQVGLLLAYDHQPSLTEVPLFDPAGLSTGLNVPARAAKLDTTLTVSLVLSFAPKAATP